MDTKFYWKEHSVIFLSGNTEVNKHLRVKVYENICVNLRNSCSSAKFQKTIVRNHPTVQLKRFLAYSLYWYSPLIIFPHESLTLITNQFIKHRKTSYMHFYQTDTAHCGNMPRGLEDLSWPYQATLAIGKQDFMKTASFSFSVPKLPTLFFVSIAETARKNPPIFPSWHSDFKPAEILQMTFAKAVLKFPYFQSPCKNCKFNTVDGLESNTYFQEWGKNDRNSFLH